MSNQKDELGRIGVDRLKERSDGAGVDAVPAPAFGLEPAYMLSLRATMDELERHV